MFASAGHTEWSDLRVNRPITQGDRLWADRGARAELHVGSVVLHMDSESFLDLSTLNENAFQASLNRGSVNIRVRALGEEENVEVDTPQLAFRAAQPGDYRIDVEESRGVTAVTVRSGIAVVFGAGGQPVQLRPGSRHAFTGRNLQPASAQTPPVADEFARWADQHNRQEDRSAAAQYLSREVVGYSQLDPHGSWAYDAGYGSVWYPRVKAADWAPYRYGRWEWIAPWGWTWIDDSPWGFAPFHYGRWALIGSRWAWVPEGLGQRPVYAPALVAFIGDPLAPLSSGRDAGIGWFPLAPGEAWRPGYPSSIAYLRDVNGSVSGNSVGMGSYFFRARADAITVARIEDFIQGRAVHSRWRRASPDLLARAQLILAPAPQEPGR